MSDVVYSVEVQFLQNGNFQAPARGISDLHDKTDKWSKSLFGAASNFAGAFNGAIDNVAGKLFSLGETAVVGVTGALATGMAAAVKMAFDFNEQMETTTISLAAIANSNGLVDTMGGGMRIAGEVIKDMRKDAAALPGEFKDLENIMTTITSAGAQAGVGMFPMEKMAAQIMTAAEVLKVPQQVAAREMAMMLEGNARHSMPFFQRLGIGMDTKHFNALAPKDRLEAVRTALNKLNPALDYFSNSWKGIKTTAIDAIRRGVGAIGGPLFQSVKEMVKAFNLRALTKTDDLRDFGFKVGQMLDNAFHHAVDSVKHWYPIVKDFAENMYEHLHSVWMRLQPLIHRVLGRVETFMKDPAAFDKIVHAAETMAALRAGGGVLEGGFSLASGAGGMLKGVEAIGGAGGMGAGLEAIGAAAGPAALAIAALAAGVYGAIDIITDSTAPFHDWAVDTMKDNAALFEDIGHQLVVFGHQVKPLAQILGADLIGALKVFLTVVDYAGTAVNYLVLAVRRIGDVFQDVATEIAKRFGFVAPMKDDPIEVARIATVAGHVIAMNATAEKEKERKVPTHVTNIHHVEIKVAPNPDPNRVAKRTADIIKDLARHPKVAQLTGVPELSRL